MPLDHVPSGSLVRYRGMIQDQFDLEFYPKVFTIVNRKTGDKVCWCMLVWGATTCDYWYNNVVIKGPGSTCNIRENY